LIVHVLGFNKLIFKVKNISLSWFNPNRAKTCAADIPDKTKIMYRILHLNLKNPEPKIVFSRFSL